jgi:hypothetical protein
MEVLRRLSDKQKKDGDAADDLSVLLDRAGETVILDAISGDDEFWAYSVDLDHPKTMYKFTIEEYSRYTHRLRNREDVYAYLSDEDYIALLAQCLSNPNTTFNLLALSLPDVFHSLMAQFNSFAFEEGHKPFGDMPFVVYMDEVEEDVEKIYGPWPQTETLYQVNGGDLEETTVSIVPGKLTVEKEENEFYPGYDPANETISSILDNIPTEPLFKIFDVEYDEDLLVAFTDRFVGEDAYSRVKEFLQEEKIPFEERRERDLY